MTWLKLGNIFDPKEHGLISHAQVPTVFVGEDEINIFFSSRNIEGKSLPYKATFSRDDPTHLIKFNKEPILGFGEPGTFDDDGVMPSAIIEFKDELLMYYSGWNQRVTVPYHNSTGVAVSHDKGLTFKRKFLGPVLDRTPTEPYIAVTPSIIHSGERLEMWYVSGIRWEEVHGKYEPVYVIKHAYSKDGVNWIRPPKVSIPQLYDQEAFSHPSVVKEGNIYHMWYCSRGSVDFRNGKNSYRMGYASSEDGINWLRQDNRNTIPPSDTGWDSKMICYPFVFNIDEQRYMVYNGNGFGASGFGLAKWVDND